MKLRSSPEEPVSHNPAAKKRVWFRKEDLPPFTQIARVVVPPGEVLTAHAHADVHEIFIILEGNARMVVKSVRHELSPWRCHRARTRRKSRIDQPFFCSA